MRWVGGWVGGAALLLNSLLLIGHCFQVQVAHYRHGYRVFKTLVTTDSVLVFSVVAHVQLIAMLISFNVDISGRKGCFMPVLINKSVKLMVCCYMLAKITGIYNLSFGSINMK